MGAHYYLWFPDNFAGGKYLRARLLPNQLPVLGEYSSASATIAEQHIAWATSAGIDFFTLDWWPGVTLRNARIEQSILAARNLDSIRFCIFYELGGLGYDPRHRAAPSSTVRPWSASSPTRRRSLSATSPTPAT